MLRDHAISFIASSGVTVGPPMMPTSKRLVTFRLISKFQFLRDCQRMNIQSHPFGAADCWSNTSFEIAFLARSIGVDENGPAVSVGLHRPRDRRVMVSAVVLPLSHHQ